MSNGTIISECLVKTTTAVVTQKANIPAIENIYIYQKRCIVDSTVLT